METQRIVVLGGGPAGSIAALALHRLGFAVTVVAAPRRPAVEGLSERVLEALRRAGCARALDAVGPPVPRRSSWGGQTTVINREWVVERDRLDAGLLEDLRQAGVSVIEGTATAAEPVAAGWQITVRGRLDPLAADFLVEARGRRAPHRTSSVTRGPAALAVARRFSVPVRAPFTAIAACRDGWAWFGDAGRGWAVLQCVFDTETLGSEPGLDALHTALVSNLPEAAAWLGPNAVPLDGVTGRDAGATLQDEIITARMLRVGDAAFAIDPLSGHGMFEAAGGAMAAAPVINTLLRRPEDAALAMEFYETRARGAFLRHARVGRELYALETRWPTAPFWAARQVWPDAEPSHPEPGAARLENRPVVENGMVVRRAVVVSQDQPRGVRFIDGVDLAAVVDLLGQGVTDPEALAVRLDQPPAAVRSALAWLRGQGVLGD